MKSQTAPSHVNAEEIFANGYTRIRWDEVTPGQPRTNLEWCVPGMSTRSAKKGPAFNAPDVILKPRSPKPSTEISMMNFAKKFAEANGGRLSFRSKSGSCYVAIRQFNILEGKKYRMPDFKVRISDHNISSISGTSNPGDRYDLEIVQWSFDESDSVLISDYQIQD